MKCISSWFRLRRSPRFVFAFLIGILAAPCLQLKAKTSSWKDAQGTSFRGEPMEILGPWALFSTGQRGGRRVLLRGLSPDDCRRFHEEISRRPARAASLAGAQGLATSDLVGHVLQLKNKNLVPADLAHMPEPQLLLVLFGSHNDGESWQMVGADMQAVLERIQRVLPGMMGTVFMGVRHNETEHREIVTQMRMPWLIADLHAEASMRQLELFAPAEGTNMVLLSREGVPLLSARATDLDAMRQFIDQLVDIAWQINPDNARNWKDRAAYLGAVRPVEYAQSHADVLLIGSPLRVDVLRKYGVTRVSARLEVTADGKIVPTLRSTAEELPPALVAPLTEALRQAVALPAIEHGVAVAGGLDYQLDIPPANPPLDNDILWLGSTSYPVLPIDQWLLLRPIKIPEADFESSVESETASGTLVFKALKVSDAKVSRSAQMNAFNSDWFTAAGAASVQPKDGDTQSVDGTRLTWQRVKADRGFVNLQTGATDLEYTVGYAWTEFDVPADGIAWLGLGSDDGVKVWLNGELIHDKWVARQSRIDDDIIPLSLKQGRNRILLKIQNVKAGWSFLYRIRTAPK